MIINIEKRKIYKFDLYEKTFKYLKNSFKQKEKEHHNPSRQIYEKKKIFVIVITIVIWD